MQFTAVKRRKLPSLPVFRSLEGWNSSNVYQREVRMKTIHNVSRQTEFHASKTCAWQLLYFEHMINVKSLSFQRRRCYVLGLKGNFRHLSVFWFVKLWRELCTRRAFDRFASIQSLGLSWLLVVADSYPVATNLFHFPLECGKAINARRAVFSSVLPLMHCELIKSYP